MTPSFRVVRRLVLAFVGVTLVTFAILDLARPAIETGDPKADAQARARAARLGERYALDRPLFFNADPKDARAFGPAPLLHVEEASVESWIAAARKEVSGRGGPETRAELARAGDAITKSGRAAVAALLPRLLRENALVLGLGLECLKRIGLPAFPAVQGDARVMLRPDQERANDAIRRSVALWWRRHENEFRERSALWHAVFGRLTETRYAAWLGDLVRLDFGDSLAVRPEEPVGRVLRERLPVTLLVMGLATVLLFLVGVPLGVLCAARKGGAFDRTCQGVLFLLHATPEAWIATLALVYLASEAHVHWFPVGGLLSPEVSEALAAGAAAWWSPQVLADAAWHLALPVLVLVFPAWVVVVRHLRANAILVLGSRFVTALRARGVPRRRILFAHVLKSCAPVAVTLFTSVLPGLVTGSILVEMLFGLEGMGLLSWQAATQRDFPVAMAVLTIVAVVMIAAHVLTDLLHALVDPRVRAS
jgi:ABC-type dipeptide/oligopeptide/nickel transport system permease component